MNSTTQILFENVVANQSYNIPFEWLHESQIIVYADDQLLYNQIHYLLDKESNTITPLYNYAQFLVSRVTIYSDLSYNFLNTKVLKSTDLEQAMDIIRHLAEEAYTQGGNGTGGVPFGFDVVGAVLAHQEALRVLNEEDLPELYNQLDNLNNVELPALEADINELNTVKIPNLQAQLDNLNNTQLPALEADLNELNTVKLPNLQADIDSKIPDEPFVIDETNMADNSISTRTIRAEAILANHIAAGTITTHELNVDEIVGNEAWFNKLTANHIAAKAITASEIATNTITTNELNIDEIVGNEAWFNKLTANHIAADTITTNELNVNEIVGNTAWFGKITADHVGTNEIVTNKANIGEAVIEDLHIVNVSADKIDTGYLSADRIAAGSITSDKLLARPANNLPDKTIAYWTNSLIDEIQGTSFEGFGEITLSREVLLTPENAPPGSVVGDLIAGNVISADKYIQAGDANRNYKLDGTQGLIRGIYGTNYNIPVIVKHGIVNFSGQDWKYTIDISELHLTNYYVTLNEISNYHHYIADRDYQKVLLWMPNGLTNESFTIWDFTIYPKEWALATNNTELTITIPTSGWSSWYQLNQTYEGIAIRMYIKYYKGSTLSNTRYPRHFASTECVIQPYIRCRKTTNAIESEIKWHTAENEIITTTLLNSTSAIDYTSIKVKVDQYVKYYRMINGSDEIEYTIIGY